MEAKEVRSLMEAYASVYEGYGKKKKGDCVSKSEKGDHNCAKKVCHEEYGEGETIFGQHAVPDENGFVSHYNVQFEHGIVEDVSVEELDVLTMEAHNEHVEHQEDTISEMGGMMGAIKKVAGKGPADQSPKAEAARKGKRRPASSAPSKSMDEDADLYDLIKGHLIDEGFADTEEAAHSIMISMSEQWRQSIVEAVDDIAAPPSQDPLSRLNRTLGKAVNFATGQRHAEVRSKKDGVPGNVMVKQTGPFSTKNAPVKGSFISDKEMKRRGQSTKPLGRFGRYE